MRGLALQERAYLVLALANVVRQYEFELDLCMGTANAAGVGQERHVCGHCYLILTCNHIESSVEARYIVEVRMHTRCGAGFLCRVLECHVACEMLQSSYTGHYAVQATGLTCGGREPTGSCRERTKNHPLN